MKIESLSLSFLAALFATLALGLTSCKEEGNSNKNRTPYVPIEITRGDKEVIDETNRFAWSLLEKTCRSSADNVFQSPLSVAYALGMLVNGAEGETKDEILSALNAKDLKALNRTFSILSSRLPNADASVRFTTANSIWVADGFPLKYEFCDSMSAVFNAEIFNVDMKSDKTRDRINQWCYDKTNGTISNFLPDAPGGIASVFNAVYFKGNWQQKFNEHESVVFKNTVGYAKRVTMMKEEMENLRYSDDKWSQSLQLPYGNGAFYMEICLPAEGLNPEDVIAARARGEEDPAAENHNASEIVVIMPKFELSRDMNLLSSLQALGINKAFSENADFSNMTPGQLMFNKVVQKAYVKVDENGTEASAVTQIGGLTALPPQYFVLDRPFIFFIREKSTGVIIFSGVIRNI